MASGDAPPLLRSATAEPNRLHAMRSYSIDHGSLLVSDVRASVRFFTDALGLVEVPRPPTFDAPGAWLQVGQHHQIHLVGEAEPGRAREQNPPYAPEEIVIGYGNHLALVVDDLDATLRARG